MTVVLRFSPREGMIRSTGEDSPGVLVLITPGGEPGLGISTKFDPLLIARGEQEAVRVVKDGDGDYETRQLTPAEAAEACVGDDDALGLAACVAQYSATAIGHFMARGRFDACRAAIDLAEETAVAVAERIAPA